MHLKTSEVAFLRMQSHQGSREACSCEFLGWVVNLRFKTLKDGRESEVQKCKRSRVVVVKGSQIYNEIEDVPGQEPRFINPVSRTS